MYQLAAMGLPMGAFWYVNLNERSAPNEPKSKSLSQYEETFNQ